jgi:LysM repeat protein
MSIAAPMNVSQFPTSNRGASAATRVTTSAAPAAATVAPTVRLTITRRGQVVLAAFVTAAIIVVLAMLALFGGGSAVATGGAGSADFQYVTVQSGQSLWGIAEKVAPKADPRDVVAAIVSLNDLSQSAVQAGQRIAIPPQYSN